MKTGYDRLGRELHAGTAQRMCFDKKVFSSRNRARDEAAKLKKTRGMDLRPYRCVVCKLFHLTTLNKEDGHQARRRIWRKTP